MATHTKKSSLKTTWQIVVRLVVRLNCLTSRSKTWNPRPRPRLQCLIKSEFCQVLTVAWNRKGCKIPVQNLKKTFKSHCGTQGHLSINWKTEKLNISPGLRVNRPRTILNISNNWLSEILKCFPWHMLGINLLKISTLYLFFRSQQLEN